jgi:hypothetical protein
MTLLGCGALQVIDADVNFAENVNQLALFDF